MPTVSGTVVFSATYSKTTVTSNIANVPVVLQDTTTGNGLVVLTSSTGTFTFNNVPAGTYRLVESWGFPGGVATPGDFANAAAIAVPVGTDPPASAITSPPAGTTYIASVTPNTLNVTVAAADVTGLFFRDAPYTELPLAVQDVTYIGGNLLTAGNNGDWGTLPAGTPSPTWPNADPYPGLVSGLTYVNDGNIGSQNTFTVSNIFSFGGFIADHTSGDETGRAAYINGGNPNTIYYRETVAVEPNSYYQLSNWIVGLAGTFGPTVGYRVRTVGGTLLFSQDVAVPSVLTPRRWQEVGTLFNAGNNTQLLIQFTSQATAFDGNDFAVDDMSLVRAEIADILTAEKFVDKENANVGEVLEYTVVLKNTGESTITSLIFVDTVPNGTIFNTGTVRVNGTTVAAANPSNFTVATPPMPMTTNEVITVTYKVTINTVPSPNPIPNSATANYVFAPIVGGATIPATVTTSIVNTAVSNPVFTSTKAVDKTNAGIGDTVTYTFVIRNLGNTTFSNIILRDTIPNGTTFVTDSLFINSVVQTGENPAPPTGATIGTLPVGSVSTVTFTVLVTTIPSPNPFVNSGTFSYNFFVGTSTIASSGSSNTNSVSTRVSAAALSSIKSVDKTFGNIGDTITYTVVLRNTGNATANNVTFIDTIPNGTTLNTGSLRQDGTAIAGSPNPPGVTLSNIAPGVTSTIVFSVRVNSIPSPNPIPNTAVIGYTYTVDPSTPNGNTGVTNTNTVTTQINNASIPAPSKRVDKAFAKVGDTLLYTIVLQNTGNTSAVGVILRDTIPNNTTFEANSVTINGVTQTGAVVAPPTGLTIGTIPAGSITTVTFIVSVDTIPSPNPIPNTATTTYSYTVDTTLGTTVTESGRTNTVTTQVNTAMVGTTKVVSAANILAGDTVTYTMVVRNTGNTTANSVLLTDTIPTDGTFVTDSVTVNGTTQTGINPQTNGVVLPTLPVGGVATVTFQVAFSTIPNPNPAINTAVTSYSYLLDPSTPTNQNASGSSNSVSTFVNPNSNPLKVVNKTSATVGETLVYFIQWMNITNTTQTNVIFVDTLPNGVTFVPNTLTVNGLTQTGATITPPNGINTGTLPLNSTVSITYQVLISTVPSPNPIPNTASVTQTGLSGTQTAETNQVTTQVNFAELSQAAKSRDKAFATVGDTITYTLVYFNNGNTSANNVLITDTIPNGTSFNINSVTVNGVTEAGAVVAPPTGLTLSCIPPGTAATITFVVTVQSIPTPNPTPNTATATYSFVINNGTGQTQSGNSNTNTVTTTIVDATIVSTKTVSKSFAQVGDTLTYTIVLVATGNTTANNAVLIDSLPSTLTYVPGTFAINGGIVAGANPAPPGQSIGSLTVPATYTITFNAVVNTIPSANPIQNEAQTNYAYTVEPTIANSRTRGSITNIANTTVSQASLGGITKATDKLFADCGETVTYTIVIPNSGNATATNVVFRDTIPSGTVLVTNSVTVNGITQTGASPQTGINLGTIGPAAVTTVVFKVTVQC